MMKFYPAVFASVLFATASAQTCKDLKLGEEAIIPGDAYRGFHPKPIGCVSGTFTVDKYLPKDLRVGLFKEPGASYSAFARISHVAPIYPPDSIGDSMELGKSIGLILDGVDGKKLQPAFEDSSEFHFLMNSAEEFWCPDMQCMLALITSIRRSKDRPTIPSNPDTDENCRAFIAY